MGGAAEFCSLASRPGVCLLVAKVTMGPKLCSYNWTPLSSFISLVNFCEHLSRVFYSVFFSTLRPFESNLERAGTRFAVIYRWQAREKIAGSSEKQWNWFS